MIYILFAISHKTIHLPLAHPTRPVGNLPMQIRHLDDVAIHNPQRAHTGAGEICRGGTAEAAGADD